jgi:two-component system NtrC family sensor kinase
LLNHLSQQNYQLVEAPGGQEALKAIEEQGPFDLLLLDIMMPKVSGYEVCQKLRQTYPATDLVVIFLTAKNQVSDLVQSFAAGANDYLSKPVSKHELLTRVASHLKLLDTTRTLEYQVKERTNKLIQAEKMASLGTLTAGVAHEINNPTNFIHVSTENLATDLNRFKQFIFELAGEDADEEILENFRKHFNPLHQHLLTIKNGSERIRVIVKDLHAFTQLNSAEHKPIVIAQCLQSIINLIKTQNQAVAQFVTEFEPSNELLCYPAQLNQTFMNLINNACDAIREKQRQNDLQNDRQNKQGTPGLITVGCRTVDNAIEITIKDNGCGMSDETKKKLFEPFFTTKTVGEGTGLGLSIAYGIVQKHDGELSVESELGEGSMFRLRLPVIPLFIV